MTNVATVRGELGALIPQLASEGGMIGPSIYDTAQVLRLEPSMSGGRQVVDWLVGHQAEDGGWGDPATQRARDVPTLAATLAIHAHAAHPTDRAVVARALKFLHRHARIWQGRLPDALPVGVELLLPRLLHEATRAGLDVPVRPYRGVVALGRLKKGLGTAVVRRGTPPAHSWEAFGTKADLRLLDRRGSVGNSPAATAAWLRQARASGTSEAYWHLATDYLKSAAAATRTGVPGVVPTVWPIERFEHSFGLYALLIGGLLDERALSGGIAQQIDALAAAMRPTGLGMSDDFTPDGDDTATALAVLDASGRPADLSLLERFTHGNHFVGYHGELQPSVSVVAHAVHALALAGVSSGAGYAHMIQRQLPDGRWSDDKWHGSWIYTTSQVLVALAGTPSPQEPIDRATKALILHQHEDGGWGTGAGESNTEETAYAVLALRSLTRHRKVDAAAHVSLGGGERWMRSAYRPFAADDKARWLGKENYRPNRIVRMFELAATLPSNKILRFADLPAEVGTWELEP